MNSTSLNKLAWKKLKKDRLAFTSLIFIFFCVLIAVFATIISPDRSKNANEMHIELATNKPLTKIIFLELPKQISEELSIIEKLIFGTTSKVSRIPISSFEKLDGGLTYLPFQSEMEKNYFGDYKIVEQTFWFGTDKYGRDLLSRIILGTRISLSVGFIAVIISLIIGISFGLIAGYFRGKTDDVIMWFVNVIWSIPTLLMVIAITLALGKGFWQVFIAVGLTMWVEVARVVRGQVKSLKEREFITAAHVLGFSDFRIITRHILPNIISPLIIISAANFAASILIESGLSFLGLGAQPPMSSWGSMIKDHYNYIILGEPFLAIIPGVCIMLLVCAFMLFGNSLRDLLDVRI